MGDLAGRTFLSTAVTRNGTPQPLAGGSRVSLTFTAQGVTASAGCNTLGGEGSLDAGRLVLSGPMQQTEMGCEPALMEQDGWLAAVLTSGPRLEVGGDRLVLTAEQGGGTVVVELLDARVARPDLPLLGTPWTLDGIATGQTASSVPAGVTSTLRFQPGGRFTVSGCNRGGGSVTVSGGELAVEGMALTQKGCPAPEAEVEGAVLAVFRGRVTYTVDGDRLTLTNGGTTLSYRAAR
jgi:heat shock protein HslJ